MNTHNPSAMADTGQAVLEISNIKKNYGAVKALKGVSFTVNRGEVVGLVGDNGAGKSTLVKILAGAVQPSSGTTAIEGRKVEFHGPGEARDAGVECVYQDLALVEEFDVASNFFLGRELYYGGLLAPLGIARKREMRRRSFEAVKKLGIKIPSIETSNISDMSGGQRQAVAIARSAFWQGKLLLLDEPTAALGVAETAEVNALIQDLQAAGEVGIILISHNMKQVQQLCDKAVVLQQGHHVATLSNPDQNDLVAYITGAKPPQRELVFG